MRRARQLIVVCRWDNKTFGMENGSLDNLKGKICKWNSLKWPFFCMYVGAVWTKKRNPMVGLCLRWCTLYYRIILVEEKYQTYIFHRISLHVFSTWLITVPLAGFLASKFEHEKLGIRRMRVHFFSNKTHSSNERSLTFFSNKAPGFLWGAKPKIGHLVVDSERSPFHLYLKACRPDRPNLEFVRAMEKERNYIQANASQWHLGFTKVVM